MDGDNPQEKITLKQLREQAGLTQEALARRINRSFRTVGDWETGKSIPRLDNAIETAKALGVSLNVLSESLGLSLDGLPTQQENGGQ